MPPRNADTEKSRSNFARRNRTRPDPNCPSAEFSTAPFFKPRLTKQLIARLSFLTTRDFGKDVVIENLITGNSEAYRDSLASSRGSPKLSNSFHETNHQRRSVFLELGSNQGTLGLSVRVPARLVPTFTHDFADAVWSKCSAVSEVDAATWILKLVERQFRPVSSPRSLFEGNHAMSFVLQPSGTRQRIDRPW